MPYLGFTLSNAHQRDVSHIVGSDGVTFKIDADLRQGEFFTVDAVLTTKPTPMIYSDNHLRDITPILLSTPPPAETFSVDAVLTTVPVYYRFDNNHLHTIQAKFKETLCTPEELTQLSSHLVADSFCLVIRLHSVLLLHLTESTLEDYSSPWKLQLKLPLELNCLSLTTTLQDRTSATLSNHSSATFKPKEVFLTSLLFVMRQITLLTLLMPMNSKLTSSSNLHVLSTSSVLPLLLLELVSRLKK